LSATEIAAWHLDSQASVAPKVALSIWRRPTPPNCHQQIPRRSRGVEGEENEELATESKKSSASPASTRMGGLVEQKCDFGVVKGTRWEFEKEYLVRRWTNSRKATQDEDSGCRCRQRHESARDYRRSQTCGFVGYSRTPCAELPCPCVEEDNVKVFARKTKATLGARVCSRSTAVLKELEQGCTQGFYESVSRSFIGKINETLLDGLRSCQQHASSGSCGKLQELSLQMLEGL